MSPEPSQMPASLAPRIDCVGETTIGAWLDYDGPLDVSLMFRAECSGDDGSDCGWSVDLRERYGEMVTEGEVHALHGEHIKHRARGIIDAAKAAAHEGS